eukprot:6193412-Pleurochrysis_carterae.AAC.1
MRESKFEDVTLLNDRRNSIGLRRRRSKFVEGSSTRRWDLLRHEGVLEERVEGKVRGAGCRVRLEQEPREVRGRATCELFTKWMAAAAAGHAHGGATVRVLSDCERVFLNR